MELLSSNNITFKGYKDQVIFEKNEVVKQDNAPYTVFTPFKNKWLEAFKKNSIINYDLKTFNFISHQFSFPTLSELGFKRSEKEVQSFQLNDLENYKIERNIPSLDHTRISESKRWVVIRPNGESSCNILLARAANEEQISRIGNQTGGRVFLFLYTDDIKKDYQNLLENQVKIIRELEEQPHGWVCV